MALGEGISAYIYMCGFSTQMFPSHFSPPSGASVSPSRSFLDCFVSDLGMVVESDLPITPQKGHYHPRLSAVQPEVDFA